MKRRGNILVMLIGASAILTSPIFAQPSRGGGEEILRANLMAEKPPATQAEPVSGTQPDASLGSALPTPPSMAVVETMPTTYTYRPQSTSSHLSQAGVWGVIIVGLASVGFLLWRNRQIDKTARRWRKRQSKWRLF